MDFKPFIEKYYSNYSQGIVERINRCLHQVEDMLIKTKKTCDTNNDNDIISFIFNDVKNIDTFFIGYTPKSISTPNFYTTKKFCYNFFEYLWDKKLISNYQEILAYLDSISVHNISQFEDLTTSYFKNVESIISSIDYVGQIAFSNKLKSKAPRSKLTPYNSEKDLVNFKSIAILTWNGLEVDEILQLDKSDIKCIDNKYFIKTKKGNRDISKIEYDILKAFNEATFYRGLPSCRIIKLIDSPKLFRVSDQGRNNESISPFVIHSLVKRYNNYAKKIKSPKILDLNNIRKSGFYAMVYRITKGDKKRVVDTIMKLSGCSMVEAYKKSYRYYNWIETFYKNN